MGSIEWQLLAINDKDLIVFGDSLQSTSNMFYGVDWYYSAQNLKQYGIWG